MQAIRYNLNLHMVSMKNRQDIEAMDKQKSIPPAQLWVGTHDDLVHRTTDWLQELLCQKRGCRVCITCTHIRQQQHYATVWLAPEKYYTREELSPIFSTIAYAQQEGQRTFFILQHADFLTTACANSLLKSLEEPPPGYHFILLAERPDSIVATIRSRCIVHTYESHAVENKYQELLNYFTSVTQPSANRFLQTINSNPMHERDSIQALDWLLRHWLQQYSLACADSNAKQINAIAKKIATLKNATKHPPMPGSSKLFWKNLFLQMN